MIVASLISVSPARSDPAEMALGRSAYELGDMVIAAKHFEAAREAFVKNRPPDHPDTLMSMQDLARARLGMGQPGQAEPLLQAVLQARRRSLGERDAAVASVLQDLGTAQRMLGRLKEALSHGEQAVQMSRELLGERHVDTLSAMSELAETLGTLGRHDEQLALYQRVRDLRTEILGPRDRQTLVAMSNLAGALQAAGRHAEALRLYEQAGDAQEAILGARHPDTLSAMSDRATTLQALGRLAEALTVGERSLRLATESLGESHPLTLTILNNLGYTLFQLGRFDELLPIHRRLAAQMKALHGERHPLALTAASNLAFVLRANALFDESVALDTEVLRVRTEVLGDKHPLTVASIANVAFALGELGRHEEQLALNLKALALFTELRGPRHPDTLTALNNLGSTYGMLGRNADQISRTEEAARLATDLLGDRHPNTLSILARLAAGYRSGGRLDDAARLTDRYVAGAEWQRAQPGLSTANRQSVFRQYAIGYRLFSTVQVALGRRDEAFRLAELGKARTLLESVSAQKAGRSGALPAGDAEALDDLLRRMTGLDQRIAQAASDDGARIDLEAQRNALAREYQSLQQRLKERWPKYAQLGDVQLLAASDLHGLLDADTVAVSYVVFKEDVVAFVVDAQGLSGVIDLGRINDLGPLVELLHRTRSWSGGLREVMAAQSRRVWRLPDGRLTVLSTSKAAPDGAVAVDEVEHVAAYLGQRLLGPLSASLRSKKRWLLSPDAGLALLPFETLPFGEGGDSVLAHADVHYTPSLSVYALSRTLRQQHQGMKDRRELLAMGNAVYQSVALPAGDRRDRLRGLPLRSEPQLRDLDALWQNLPGTETEVRGVAALFPGSASVYTGPQATEARLMALNASGELRQHRFLLFAAHGYVSTTEPALSSIVLGLQDREAGTDGYVTAAEWTGYDLRSDLVVLSACDTGVGQVNAGEGVLGLPFALFVAGSANTVLTLWPVEDQTSARFVRDLFAKLKAGQPPSQALAATKREFVLDPKTRHPRFWAPFVLLGAN